MGKNKKGPIKIKPSLKFENLHIKTFFKKFLILVYFLLGTIIIYHVYYGRKIIPGVKVGSVEVGGMTFSQAKEALMDYESDKIKEYNLVYDDKEFKISANSIDLTYDWDGVVDRAFEVGRTGDVVVDTKDKIAGFFKTLYIGSYYDYSDDLLNVNFSVIKGEVNEPAVNAGIDYDGEDLVITPSKKGRKVDTESLYDIFVYAFDRMDFADKKLPVMTVYPEITEKDLISVLDSAKEVLSNDIKVVYEDKEWNISREDKLSFLEFDVIEGSLEMRLSKLNFEAFIDTLAEDVNKLPKGEVTKLEGKRVIEFNIIQEGIELDRDKLSEDFKSAFFDKKSEVIIPVKEISGPGSKEKYGIFALLGEGVSKYTGSASSRIHNLTLAAERTSGVLVPPGEVYSMNAAVGKINSATGYNTAYIISQGRTVLGTGGGVCQTSTTLFRAVLNSGLPVESRTPHAYRVGYYEIESEPGLDATIYQPTVDFKFKNDTPNYILVQATSIPEENILKFSIYGTPDGREVEMSDVTVTGETPPPAPLYQEDPSLAKGVTRQVDFAAWGATATFSRTVKKDDEVLFEDTYTTRYQPWRAVFLVGTKE